MRPTPICHRTIGLPMGARECMGSTCSLWVETQAPDSAVKPAPQPPGAPPRTYEVYTFPGLGMCAEGRSTWENPAIKIGDPVPVPGLP